MKNIKVGKCKSSTQILNHVTALISEHILKPWLDYSSLAKLGKRVLQKAESVLEPCDASITSHCLKIWDWADIFLILITGVISEQFSKLWSGHLSNGKLGKHILQQTLILTFDTIVFLCIKHAPERPQITIKHFPWKYYIIILSCWPPMGPFR